MRMVYVTEVRFDVYISATFAQISVTHYTYAAGWLQTAVRLVTYFKITKTQHAVII